MATPASRHGWASPQPTLAALPRFRVPGPAQISPLSARPRGPLPASARLPHAAESPGLRASVSPSATPPDQQLQQTGPSTPSVPTRGSSRAGVLPLPAWQLSASSHPATIQPQGSQNPVGLLPQTPDCSGTEAHSRGWGPGAPRLRRGRAAGPRRICDHVGCGRASFAAAPGGPLSSHCRWDLRDGTTIRGHPRWGGGDPERAELCPRRLSSAHPGLGAESGPCASQPRGPPPLPASPAPTLPQRDLPEYNQPWKTSRGVGRYRNPGAKPQSPLALAKPQFPLRRWPSGSPGRPARFAVLPGMRPTQEGT